LIKTDAVEGRRMTHPITSTSEVTDVTVLDGHVLAPVRDPRERAWRVMVDYVSDLLTPAFNQMRAYYGIEPEPLRAGPPVTVEEAKAAADEYWMLETLRAEQAKAELAEWKTIMGHAEKRRGRPLTLASVAKQLRNADIAVARLEQKPDGTIIVVIGASAADTSDINSWDEVLNAADEKRPS
jgi:hypothetical protein